MAQHDYNLANQNGAAFRADLNSALSAIQSANSGATEPASTVAYMPWADTNSGLWKVRNAADSAWVSVLSLTASRVDTAAGTSYDNASSGLAATNVKDAIDEIVATGALIPMQDQATWDTGTDTTESLISPLKLDTKILDRFNVTGVAPLFACRAWVNFSGTGTVAIRASGNVSSITDNGVGDYTINFTTAMPDTNYAITGSYGFNTIAVNTSSIRPRLDSDVMVGGLRVYTSSVGGSGSALGDATTASVAIFR